MVIRYNPKDTVTNLWDRWGDGDHERKNDISFKIYKNDSFILNYDEVTLLDLDFYLNSRVDRREYIYMIPLLWEVRQQMLKEIKDEENFKKLVVGECLKKGTQVSEHEVNVECENWKKNLKWKRAIAHDDQKALRMIVKRLTK